MKESGKNIGEFLIATAAETAGQRHAQSRGMERLCKKMDEFRGETAVTGRVSSGAAPIVKSQGYAPTEPVPFGGVAKEAYVN